MYYMNKNQVVDILTKVLPKGKLEYFRETIMSVIIIHLSRSVKIYGLF